MRYIALIYGDETWFEHQSADDQAAHMERWSEYSDALQAAGVVAGGARLEPTAHARSVRRRRDRPLVSDGPFAETKEQLCGFLELHADTLETAVEWAERCPAADYGTVEVRPVMPE
jgi:hypothetical protein